MSDQEKEDGLTTGNLDTGSLSDPPQSLFDRNRERVAEQYAPALSGEKGPLAQFDAFTELMRAQIDEYESGKVVSSNGDTTMSGFGQFMTLSSKRSEGRGGGVPIEEDRVIYRPGFWVYASGSDAIVHPSVVSGMSAVSEIPDGVGEPISVSGVGSVIALRIEAEPTVENIGTVEDENHVIVDGGGVVEGAIEVVTFSSISAMNTASVVALIDNSDGTVTQNGIYHLPLAMIVDGGGWLQVGHIGPIGIRMCAAGSLVVNSPTLQIITLDENYNIVDPYSE